MGNAPAHKVADAAISENRPTSITDVVDEWPTWTETLETMLFQAGYNTNVVIIGTTLLGLAAGIIGVFALLRKRSLMSDALSHATLPGIGLAFLIAPLIGLDGRSLPVLLFGATVTGVIGVLCIQALLRVTRLREDAAIGIILSVFFGAGVVTLTYIQANAQGNVAGLNRFIYGQTAAMRAGDAVLMGGIALTAVCALLLLLKEFSLVCFNDTFARVDGWPVLLIDLLMMGLVVVVTVAGLQAVGLILVVAMLIIPAVSARFWTERLWLLVVLAGVIGASSGYLGSIMSALFPRKPAGAVIVLTAGAMFTFSMIAAPARGVIAVAIRRLRLRLQIAGEHILEAGYEAAADADGTSVLSRDGAIGVAGRRGWPAWFLRFVVFLLHRQGMVKTHDNGVALTALGRARGARVHRNHRLWEQYLISYADIAPSHVDWSVDQVEHVLSDELIDELEVALAEQGILIPGEPGLEGPIAS
ncbi:MAG: iron chelate uptake ABC transporter family permease subunit [Planctomycetota bacterium]